MDVADHLSPDARVLLHPGKGATERRRSSSSAPGARSAMPVAVARVGEAAVLLSARSDAGGANMLVRPQMQGWPVEGPIVGMLALQIRRGGAPDACEMTAGSPMEHCSGCACRLTGGPQACRVERVRRQCPHGRGLGFGSLAHRERVAGTWRRARAAPGVFGDGAGQFTGTSRAREW